MSFPFLYLLFQVLTAAAFIVDTVKVCKLSASPLVQSNCSAFVGNLINSDRSRLRFEDIGGITVGSKQLSKLDDVVRAASVIVTKLPSQSKPVFPAVFSTGSAGSNLSTGPRPPII